MKTVTCIIGVGIADGRGPAMCERNDEIRNGGKEKRQLQQAVDPVPRKVWIIFIYKVYFD